jgi:hypothetical protein
MLRIDAMDGHCVKLVLARQSLLWVIFDGLSGDRRLADVRFCLTSGRTSRVAFYLAFVQLASIRLWLAAHHESMP